MKKYIIILLALLIACAPEQIEQKNETKKVEMTLQNILDEFEALDAQLNTSWKQEKIPQNMIKIEALQAWTDHVLALKEIIQTDTPASVLIEVRLDMLSAQTAYYLGAEIGEKGEVILTREGENLVAKNIKCENAEEIAKATKLYKLSVQSTITFNGNMDLLLQKSIEAREKIGTNENRPAFYESEFPSAEQRIEAIKTALKEQCQIELKIN